MMSGGKQVWLTFSMNPNKDSYLWQVLQHNTSVGYSKVATKNGIIASLFVDRVRHSKKTDEKILVEKNESDSESDDSIIEEDEDTENMGSMLHEASEVEVKFHRVMSNAFKPIQSREHGIDPDYLMVKLEEISEQVRKTFQENF